MIVKSFGKETVGGGEKMQVELHGYRRSNQDTSYTTRFSAAAGTLIPFLKHVALPGDTSDLSFAVDIRTLPPIGPLFGSYKWQIDVFQAPFRLYNSLLANNELEMGLNMHWAKFPTLTLTANPINNDVTRNIDTAQVNPSCILAYLGIRGIGITDQTRTRSFNITALITYWDIYKNFYANKMEEIGAVIHVAAPIQSATTITSMDYFVFLTTGSGEFNIPQSPTSGGIGVLQDGTIITTAYSGTTPNPKGVFVNMMDGQLISLYDLCGGNIGDDGTTLTGTYDSARYGNLSPVNYQYGQGEGSLDVAPRVTTFPLENIDTLRREILAFQQTNAPYSLNSLGLPPYQYLHESQNSVPNILASQEGLGLKTYQSDMLQNWLRTEYVTAINNASAVSTAGNSFTIDQLNLATKIFYLLNRVAVSGGTYQDWIETVYDVEPMRLAQTPMWMGGASGEVVFQEVVSNALSQNQPLGTLAAKGVTRYGRGGEVIVKVKEPGYIMGIFSLTPRIDYSQGNDWDIHLDSLDDLHKAALDGIGFQHSLNEQRAWWSTEHNGTQWVQTSAGYVVAWLDYMSNINKTYGNFAIESNQMFMTLNRRYEYEEGVGIKDLTTYIDPSKFNFIFAQADLTAQNFWVQIAVKHICRRKMSAKVMPNL